MCTNFLKGNFEAGFKLNFNKDYEIVHFTEQRFTGFNVEEFENLFIGKNVDHITTAATDGMLESAQERSDFKLTDHDLNSLQNTTWPTASGGNCWLLPVIYFISAARYYRPMTESEKKAILTTYGNYSNSINSYVIGQCFGYAEDSGLDGKADYDEMSHKIIDDEEYERLGRCAAVVFVNRLVNDGEISPISADDFIKEFDIDLYEAGEDAWSTYLQFLLDRKNQA